MSAVSEWLENKWSENDITKAECRKVNNNDIHQAVLTGKLASQLKSGEAFNLIEILYIDDGAF
eukprot:scaffold20733_cov36-Cyclotella_meneghiniana.AAC.1